MLATARDRLGQNVAFDEPGVKWLDGFLQRQHEIGDPAERDGLVNTLGSYLGKCIVEAYGGAWARVDGVVCIRFDDENLVYPFAKLAKHLENGSVDSCYGLFEAVPFVFEDV